MKRQLGVSYFGSRHLRHVAADLKEIKKHGCNWVLHTYDEIDLRFNQGNLKAITAMSHKLGMQVYYSPWAIGGIFGGESLSAFTGKNPDACQVLSTGEVTGHACPSHPKFRAFIKTWIQAACAAGGDVLFWDEPHLWIAAWEGRKEVPGVFSVGSAYAQRLFKKRYGKTLPKARTPEVEEFRDWVMVDFIRWATATAKQVRRSIRNAVCLLPHVDRWPHPQWEKIAALKSVDIMATDPYWKSAPTSNKAKRPMPGYVDLMARRLVDMGRRHGKETQAWLQLFALRTKDEPDISTAVRMFEQAGVTNIGAWGFDGCASYSNIASQRPTQCWDRLGREYLRLKKG